MVLKGTQLYPHNKRYASQRKMKNTSASEAMLQTTPPFRFTSNWQSLPKDKSGLGCRAVAAWGSEHILFVGGDDNNNKSAARCDMYDIARQTWLSTPLPPRQHALDDSAAIVVYDRLYVFGGYDTNTDKCSSVVEVLDLGNISSMSEFRTLSASLPEARHYSPNAAILHHEGKIYLAGGYNQGRTNKVFVFNVSTETFETSLELQHARYCPAMTMVGDLLVIAGGNDELGPTQAAEAISLSKKQSMHVRPKHHLDWPKSQTPWGGNEVVGWTVAPHGMMIMDCRKATTNGESRGIAYQADEGSGGSRAGDDDYWVQHTVSSGKKHGGNGWATVLLPELQTIFFYDRYDQSFWCRRYSATGSVGMNLPSIHSVQEQTQSTAASSTVPDGKSSSPGPCLTMSIERAPSRRVGGAGGPARSNPPRHVRRRRGHSHPCHVISRVSHRLGSKFALMRKSPQSTSVASCAELSPWKLSAVNAGKKSLLDRLEIIESNLRLNSGRSSSVKERIELCESELMGHRCDEKLFERVAEMEAHLGL